MVLWAMRRRADAPAGGLPPPGLSLPEPGVQGPADEGPAGSLRGELYSVGFSSGLSAGKGSGSKSSQPTGMVNTLPSATVIFSVLILY